MLQGKSARWRLAPVSLVAIALTGCTLLPSPAAPPPNLFVLASQREGTPPLDVAARGIDIAPPVARPGFDGPRMAYVTRPYEIQFFTRHQWLEAPARMLAPLLAEALEARRSESHPGTASRDRDRRAPAGVHRAPESGAIHAPCTAPRRTGAPRPRNLPLRGPGGFPVRRSLRGGHRSQPGGGSRPRSGR